MERKIQWNSGCFDEIDLVYGKAAKSEVTEKILSELEEGAIAEARAYSDKIVVDGQPLTPQQFDALPDSMKEQVMYNLSGMGLSAFSAPLNEPKISVRLSPHIQFVRCCTAFSILNRLEKLDGAFNVLHPQATLEIQAPLGGKKGLVHIEMLISFLYPWLKVTEISSNEIAVQPVQEQPKPKQECTESKAPVTTSDPVQAATVCEAKPAKPSFWERLFGKKNKDVTNVTPVVPAKLEANAQPKAVKPVAAPISKHTVPASPAVQTAPVVSKAPVRPNPQPKPAPVREMVEKLSDLCDGSAPAKEMSEESASKLRKLGAEFFGDVEQVMVNEPGNTPDIQFKAISRIARYFETVPLAEYSFADNTSCPEAGKLEYYGSWKAGGTCYDGGCYSPEGDDNYYFVFRRISAKEYEEKKINRAELYKGSFSIWRYKVDLPEADSTEVFVDNYYRLYLKNPMGILGYFEIERDDR